MDRSSQELISVIVPNYNNENFISFCLNSILSQSYRNIEIIVVDDKSTDKSTNIIKEYSRRDRRIKLIRNEVNKGVAICRDMGIRLSEGTWITTLDSDDIYLSDEKIEREVIALKATKKDDIEPIVYSGIILIDALGKCLHAQPGEKMEGDILANIIARNCMIPRDFIFTRNQYLEAGGFDWKIPIYEDWDLKIRLASKYRFFYSGIDGIGYRRHGKGLSSASLLKHIVSLQRVFIKNFQHIREDRLKTTLDFQAILIKMIKGNIMRKKNDKA